MAGCPQAKPTRKGRGRSRAGRASYWQSGGQSSGTIA